MPHSARENDEDVRRFVIDHDIDRVLDVGAGSGTYAHLLGEFCHLDAIEVWQPYVEEYRLEDLYQNICVADVLWCVGMEAREKWDLVIFGDVLEHMSQEGALMVWNWAHTIARWGLISAPIVPFPQGTEHGNPYEAHVQEQMDLTAFGPFDVQHNYLVTGTFIKEFK